jgi:hypothetical protein
MLSATRFDSAVASTHRAVSGTVERVLEKLLYARDARGEWFVVALDELGGQPNGVNVKGSMDLRHVAREGALIWVDLSAARPWSPNLPASAMTRPSQALADAARSAKAIAAQRAGHRGLSALLRDATDDDPFARIARRHVMALESAIARGDVDGAAQAVRGLRGLGKGLTPSGDDVIIGVLAALEATADPTRVGVAATALPDGKTRTTELSWHALGHAANGRYPERVHDVLTAIVGGAPYQIDEVITRSIRHSGTPAVDSLVGLFVGLEAATAAATALTPA